MLRFKVILLAGALLAQMALAPIVRAGPVQTGPDWYYDTQANVVSTGPTGNSVVQYINFASISSPTQQHGSQNPTTLVNLIPGLNSTNLTGNVTVDEKYTLTVTVADTIASGPALSWKVYGEITGTYGPGVAQLNNVFTNSTGQVLTSNPSFTFNFTPPAGTTGDTFAMTLNAVALPGSPNATTGGSNFVEGAITAMVDAVAGPTGGTTGGGGGGGTGGGGTGGGGTTGGGGGGSMQQAPEPSTMLLSCLGLSVMGAAAWRKRRQARALLAANVA